MDCDSSTKTFSGADRWTLGTVPYRTLAPFLWSVIDVNFLSGPLKGKNNMKLLSALLLFACVLFAGAAGVCLNPFCGHPKWAHGKGGDCAYDTCTRFQGK
jgi:hypothetical protein